MTDPEPTVTSWSRRVLVVVLAGTALLKLTSGHTASVDTPRNLYVAACAIEALVVWLLLSRWSVVGSWMATLVAAAGSAYALAIRPRSCGCAGSWFTTDWRFELVLASLVGVLAVMSMPVSRSK